MDLVSPSARGERQLLDKSLTDLSGGRQAVGVLEFAQGLLGGGALFPVGFDRVAQLGQSGLGGQNQSRVAVDLPGQQAGDRIGRWRARCGLSWPRRRQRLGGLRRRGSVFRARQAFAEPPAPVLARGRRRGASAPPIRTTARDDARAAEEAR